MKVNVISLGFALLLAMAGQVFGQEAADSADDANSGTGAEAASSTLIPFAAAAGPLRFGAWGKAMWAPFVYRGDADGEVGGVAGDGPGMGAGSGPGWDNIGAAVGFEAKGANKEETGGFEIKLRVKAGSADVYANDNTAYLWARLFDMLRIQLGMYRYDDFRGAIGGISEDAMPGGFSGDQDAIFQRCESDSFGALFILTPPAAAPSFLQPLKAFVSFGVSGELDSSSSEFAALTQKGLAYIFASPHAGIGYDLADTVFFRAQYIGSNYKYGHGDDWYNSGKLWFPSHVREAARLEAAFNLKFIENLNIDIGVGVPFAVTVMKDDYGTPKGVGPTLKELGDRTGSRRDTNIAASEGDVYQPPMNIAAAADWRNGQFSLRGRARFGFGEKVVYDAGGNDFTGGFDIEAGFEPAYTFGFGTISGDLAIKAAANDSLKENNVISHNGTVDLGLGAWYTRDLGSGVTVKAGVAANVPLTGDAYFWTPNGTEDQIEAKTAYRNSKLLVSIPLILTVSLF
jgi:hypothetical protein